MTTIKFASIGSISHGTLRTVDLLETFADELEWHVQRNADAWCSEEGRVTRDELVKLIGDARECDPDEDESAGDILDELSEALSTFAPPYCFFGACAGDGADFGFWPDMEAIEELPRVSDPNEVEAMGEACVFVNDHGNVTVYGPDGAVAIDFV